MDKLTGLNDNNTNSDRPNQTETDKIVFNSSNRKVDNNSFLPFLDSNLNNKHKRRESSPGLFLLVENLDPTKVSDEDFYQISKQLNNEDFVRAAYLAYLKLAVSRSELDRLIGILEGHKDGRRFILEILRGSSLYMNRYDRFENLPIIRQVRKLIENFSIYLLRLARKILGIQRMEVLQYVNLIMEQDEFLLGACIDEGRSGCSDNFSIYIVDGWVLPNSSQSCAIRLACDGKFLGEGNLIVHRPDVTREYCLTSNIHNWGYRIPIHIKDLPEGGTIQIQANFGNGSMVAIGLIQFRIL
jgi:hypothetical protein